MISYFNRMHHVAVICSDYARSKSFYVDLLGLRVVRETYRRERDSYKLDLAVGDHTMIELFSFPSPPARVSRPEAAGLRHLAFEVENIDEVFGYLRGHGVECEPVRVDEMTGKRFTFFRDPDALPVEVYER